MSTLLVFLEARLCNADRCFMERVSDGAVPGKRERFAATTNCITEAPTGQARASVWLLYERGFFSVHYV